MRDGRYEYRSLRRAILMQIKGAEASGQAWRDGSPKCMAAMEPRAINDRSGSKGDISVRFGAFPLYPRKQTPTVYSQYHMVLSLRVFTRIAFGMMAKIGSCFLIAQSSVFWPEYLGSSV